MAIVLLLLSRGLLAIWEYAQSTAPGKLIVSSALRIYFFLHYGVAKRRYWKLGKNDFGARAEQGTLQARGAEAAGNARRKT